MQLLLWLVSFLIVAFGLPSFYPFLSILSASCGYGLFWLALRPIISRKKRFFLGFLWAIGIGFVQLFWITAMAPIQGPSVYGLYLFLAGLFALALACPLLFFPKKAVFSPLLMASLATLFEWGRFHLLVGFSWNPIGMALTAFLPSLQTASVFGVFGLTFWVVFTNGLFYKAVSNSLFLKYFILAAAGPYLLGFLLLKGHSKEERDAPLTVLLVQTNLSVDEKMKINPKEQWECIYSLIEKEHQPVDLIVLPESAISGRFDTAAAQKLRDKMGGAELIMGAEKESNCQTKFFTGALHLVEGGPHYYAKQKLVPIGESLPFEWLRPLAAACGIKHFFTPGLESKVFLSKIEISPSICYDETFPELMRAGVKKGAKIHVNMTNDNWYPESMLMEQHLNIARIRAVETGRYLLRACNTGVTAIVDEKGAVLERLPIEEKGVLRATFIPKTKGTLYLFWGDSAIILLSILFLVWKRKACL